MTNKSEIKHFDVFGKELSIGSPVAFSNNNQLCIGQVTKLNPKMIRVENYTKSRYRSSYLKYPSDVVIVSGPHVTMYILKNSS